MGCRLAVLVIALAGCNQLFGLEKTILIDASDVGDVVPADVLPSSCRVFPSVEAIAATYLSGSINYGATPELLTNTDEPALFTFQVGLTGTEHVAAAVLVVTQITNCFDQCTPCPEPPDGTTYEVYWNSAFKEKETTYAISELGVQWDAPGATGAQDRSPRVTLAPLRIDPISRQAEIRIPMVDVTKVPAWVDNTSPPELSIQLRTSAPTAFGSDDHDSNTCGDSPSPPRLDVTVCQ